jgi:hypothetical protein
LCGDCDTRGSFDRRLAFHSGLTPLLAKVDDTYFTGEVTPFGEGVCWGQDHERNSALMYVFL